MNDQEILANAREIAYSNATDTYGITIAAMVYRFMPQSVKSKIFRSEEEGDNRITVDEFIPHFSKIVNQLLPKEEFIKRIQDKIDEGIEDLEEVYRLITLESIVETAEDKRITLIAEADSKEDVENNVKDLTDLLDKENIPNIIKTIADTVSKEIQRSNKELNKIEENEIELVLTTSDDPIINGEPSNYDPYNIAGGVDPDVGDNSETSDKTDTDDDSEGNSKDGNDEDKKGTEEEDEDIPEAIAGENGELYSEAFQIKYAEVLNNNLVYKVKNTVSKIFFDMNSTGEYQDNPVFQNHIIAISYGIIVLGYMLDKLDIMDADDVVARFEVITRGDDTDESEDY